jgi:hypothetical protein
MDLMETSDDEDSPVESTPTDSPEQAPSAQVRCFFIQSSNFGKNLRKNRAINWSVLNFFQDSITYEIVHEEKAGSLQNRVLHYNTRVSLKGATDEIQNGLLLEVSASFYIVVEELYKRFIKDVAKPKDRAQLLLRTEAMEHYISTEFRDVDDLTPDHLLTVLQQSQNSGLSIKFSDKIILEFLHIRLDPGWNLPGGCSPKKTRANRRKELMSFGRHAGKRSVRSVAAVGENTCMPACCVVGAAHEEMLRVRDQEPKDEEKIKDAEKEYKSLSKHPGKNRKLTSAVKELYGKIGVKFGTPLDLSHVPAIERVLDISIKVVSVPDQQCIVYKSSKHPTKGYVYLLYTNEGDARVGHYQLITNVCGYFSKHEYCQECDESYWNEYDHKCQYTRDWWCFSCHGPKCVKSEKPFACYECNATLQSKECQKLHKAARCGKTWTCPRCKKTKVRKAIYDDLYEQQRLQTNEEVELEHDCNAYYCKECKNDVDVGHRCYIKKQPYKDKIQRLLFFDVETDQSTKTHEVNFIHMIYYQQTEEEQAWAEKMKKLKGKSIKLERQLEHLEKSAAKSDLTGEDRVKVLDKLSDTTAELRAIWQELDEYDKYLASDEGWEGKWVEKSYEGAGCMTMFCEELTSKYVGYTCIAHNLKGFDGIFILRTFLDNGVVPEVICKGQKLLEIRVGFAELRFIDSFNFLPMGLAKLPAAFGLPCGSKGYFPHFFNRPENRNYVGPYPDPKYYGVAQMTAADRQKFHVWYKQQEGKIFNFKEQMAEYCAQDVVILKESCIAYRRLMCAETNCDPFAYVTLASVCNAVYKCRFMPRDKIARVPPSGYQGAKYSYRGYEWLEYLRRYQGVPGLKHAANGGEKQIGKYSVDGFDEASNTVYEFYGCFFHGCKKCYSGTSFSVLFPAQSPYIV